MEAGQTERTGYPPEQLNKPHQAPGQGAFLFSMLELIKHIFATLFHNDQESTHQLNIKLVNQLLPSAQEPD